MGSFWPKICFSWKSTEELRFITLKSDAKFEQKLICGLKMTEVWQIFTRAFENLKIGTFMGSLYPKQKMYEFKIYRGVLYHDNEK